MIKAIWTAYMEVYEGGDEALDRLIGCAAYERWLAAEMRDEYLAAAHPFELEMILADLTQATNEYA